jgi:hypothetical protein
MNIRVGGLGFLIGHSAPRMAMACVWGGRVTVRLRHATSGIGLQPRPRLVGFIALSI